jgi:hypothetical protein
VNCHQLRLIEGQLPKGRHAFSHVTPPPLRKPSSSFLLTISRICCVALSTRRTYALCVRVLNYPDCLRIRCASTSSLFKNDIDERYCTGPARCSREKKKEGESICRNLMRRLLVGYVHPPSRNSNKANYFCSTHPVAIQALQSLVSDVESWGIR